MNYHSAGRAGWSAAVLTLAALAAGCAVRPNKAANPPVHFLAPVVSDLATPTGGYPALERDTAATLEACPRGPTAPGRPLHVLALSGGGQFGAYAVGILAGWSERGDRPDFDVVTGISSGALIAPFAFLGSKYDAALERVFTATETGDVFRFHPMILHLLRDNAVASAEPLRQQIEREVTEEVLNDLRAAHRAGRRLFIGTMNLHTRRLVVWDLGAIACLERPDSGALVRKLLLASSSIPGMVPPVEIEVQVNGAAVTELHTDGGAVAEMFVRFGADMPRPDPDRPQARWLAGAHLHAIVGGKLYLDPVEGRPNCIAAAGSTVAASLYALGRADLWRLFALCAASGMAFRTAAVPQDMEVPERSTAFDPDWQKKLYKAGRDFQLRREAWRNTPPGVEAGEEEFPRAGLTFEVKGDAHGRYK